ncbi:hypothetical protein [Maritalea mediterranea]|uniref:DUF2975 domain-containing protein n=1 Tax=Maritalea mediterranea TaxID=2909667 RepID=A0ABS9E9W9_9HYPH|nr:hypothetical protein [Maritalea mediterranea]MCF4099679.1 hypothetical protein [Maritalea mediterranea]
MSNVVKFQPPPKRKPEPQEKGPQEKAARFVWVSALVGPLASALLLITLFSFSDIWRALTNPLVSSYWVQLGRVFGMALVIGVAALPFSLLVLGPYAMAIKKGRVLQRAIFIRRALLAGAIFGGTVLVALGLMLGSGLNNVGLGQILFSLVTGVIAGTMISFIWAQVIWMLASPTARRGQ